MIADFTGSNLVMKWTRDSRNADEPDIVFGDYVIDFVVNDVVQRTKYVSEEVNPQATYTFTEMCADQGTKAPSRTISVRVRERDTSLNESVSATGTFTNERPPAPSFTVTGFLAPAGATKASIHIAISPVQDDDLAGYMIFRGSSAGFTPSTGNRIYMGTSTSFFDETANVGTTYFYKVVAYDRFSSSIASLNVGSAVSAVGGAAMPIYDYKFSGVTFTPNEPSANRVSWSSGTASRVAEDGTVETKNIDAGYSATASAGSPRYVYFDWSTGLMGTATALVTAIQPGRSVLATYKGGTALIDGTSEPIIDGRKIITGTIGATQLVAGEAVITGTAQIANAVITSAHVLSLNAIKITAGTLDADRIGAGSITTNKMTANTINGDRITFGTLHGDKITANTITTSHMAANTINGNRLTANTINGNKITVNTITADQIKSGAIETGHLAAGSITTQKLSATNLQVDNIHIKKGSLGWGTEKINTSEFKLTKGVERDCVSIQIPASIEGKILAQGYWWWESDDDADVRYRLIHLRRNSSGRWVEVATREYIGDRGHGEVAVAFSMGKTFDVVGGDILRLAMTRIRGGADHFMSQLTLFGVQR